MPTAEAVMNNNSAMKATSPTNTMASMSSESMMNYTTVASNRRLNSTGAAAGAGAGASAGATRNRPNNIDSGRQMTDVGNNTMSMNHNHNISGNNNLNAMLSAASASDNNHPSNMTRDAHGWSRGGRQFASSREVYTRSLHRICLKFTTSEDEDEGKPEPGTAYWTFYGRQTTIGNGGPGSPQPDDICRRMDDSMSGPAAGILSRVTDHEGDSAAHHSMRAGLTCAWQVRGDRGDVAIRVGKARVVNNPNSNGDGMGHSRSAAILSLDANRWILCKGASFAAGNSVFSVHDFNDAKRAITVHCLRGPMRGKVIEVSADRCPYIFGRAHEADLCIMDRELSRKHGAILYLPGGGKNSNGGCFILVDLESTVSEKYYQKLDVVSKANNYLKFLKFAFLSLNRNVIAYFFCHLERMGHICVLLVHTHIVEWEHSLYVMNLLLAVLVFQ